MMILRSVRVTKARAIYSDDLSSLRGDAVIVFPKWARIKHGHECSKHP